MVSYLFLYRIKDSDDRDACAYIYDSPFRFECGHYFGGPGLHGSCYSGGDYAEYDEIETVLTREEYEHLLCFNDSIRQLGFGISPGDERYEKGLALCKEIQPVYNRLKSADAVDFYEEIKRSEDELVMREHGLDEDDLKFIYDEYGLDYHDRSVISCVFMDVGDMAEEEAWSLGLVKKGDWSERYFDYDKFGQDLLENEGYVELRDGRVACLSY